VLAGNSSPLAASCRQRIAAANDAPEARHRCYTCGKTNLTNPEMDFRYCSKCADDACYCPEHIFSHQHTLGADEAAKKT